MRTSIRTKSHVCFFSIIGLLLVLVTNPAPALAGSSFLPVILKNYDGSNPPPTPSQPPTAPTNVSATDGAYTDKVRVSWTASAGATGYKVFRHTEDNSGVATEIGTAANSPYDDTGAAVGTTYYYWVKATNGSGDSGFSSGDSGYRVANVVPPTAPTNVLATDGVYADKIQVSWTASGGATGYRVFRNTANDSAGATEIGMTSNSPFLDFAAPGTTYYYWVKATNGDGESSFSIADSGFCFNGPPPAIPANIMATDGTYPDYVRITWAAAGGADGYKVFRHAGNSSAASVQIGITGTTNYDDTGAESGIKYYYWVKACNPAGDSGFSAGDSGYRVHNLAPPSDLAVTALDSSSIKLEWTTNSFGARDFDIERGRDIVHFTPLNQFYWPGGATMQAVANDYGLRPDTYYCYRVRARGNGGNTSYTNPACTWSKAAGVPQAPSNLTAKALAGDTILLTWTNNSQSDLYKIYQSENGSAYSYRSGVFDANATMKFIFGLTPSNTYQYYIQAHNTNGDSDPSVPCAPVNTPGATGISVRFVNNTSYPIVSLIIDGVQMFPQAPLEIPEGIAFDFPSSFIIGSHTYQAVNGFWDNGSRVELYQFSGSWVQAGPLYTITIDDPPITKILPKFNWREGNLYLGGYWEGSTFHSYGFEFLEPIPGPVLPHYNFYHNGVLVGGGNYDLAVNGYPGNYTMTFNVTGVQNATGHYSELDRSFYMANGPAYWPVIYYFDFGY